MGPLCVATVSANTCDKNQFPIRSPHDPMMCKTTTKRSILRLWLPENIWSSWGLVVRIPGLVIRCRNSIFFPWSEILVDDVVAWRRIRKAKCTKRYWRFGKRSRDDEAHCAPLLRDADDGLIDLSRYPFKAQYTDPAQQCRY